MKEIKFEFVFSGKAHFNKFLMGGNVPFYQLGLGSIYLKAKAMKPTKGHAINYIWVD